MNPSEACDEISERASDRQTDRPTRPCDLTFRTRAHNWHAHSDNSGIPPFWPQSFARRLVGFHIWSSAMLAITQGQLYRPNMPAQPGRW